MTQNQNPNDPNQAGQPTELDILKGQIAQLTGVVGNLAQAFQSQNTPPAPAAPSHNINPEDWQDPNKAPHLTAQIIRAEVNQAVAPLLELRQQITRQSAYASTKLQVKMSSPQLAKYWQHIEPHLDNSFGNGQIDPTPQNIMYQAQAILGGLALTNPALFMNSAAPTPMIPSSGAEPPNNLPKEPVLRDLSPEEETIRRAQGLSKEQYLKLQSGTTMLLEPSFIKREKK